MDLLTNFPSMFFFNLNSHDLQKMSHKPVLTPDPVGHLNLVQAKNQSENKSGMLVIYVIYIYEISSNECPQWDLYMYMYK